MSEERIYVVDRIEGRRAILIGDDESELIIARRKLPLRVTEGLLLRVKCEGDVPDWSTAVADPEEQERRLSQARTRLEELRKRDPGGDLEL